MDKINVLDKGYVRLDKWMGDDLDPVNSAKVSFAKSSSEFGDPEARLLGFLKREEHTSVFRHSALTFEIYAPLFVARQWWKYAVASTHLEDQNGWNESSRRYITENNEYYLPGVDQWRSAPSDKKQGSGSPMPMARQSHGADITNFGYGSDLTQELEMFYRAGEARYNAAIKAGVAPEMARLFLPANGLYVRWRWTVSLGSLLHFIQQRVEHSAQVEMQEYARAVKRMASTAFPHTIGTL